jgi:hypothetical protein
MASADVSALFNSREVRMISFALSEEQEVARSAVAESLGSKSFPAPAPQLRENAAVAGERSDSPHQGRPVLRPFDRLKSARQGHPFENRRRQQIGGGQRATLFHIVAKLRLIVDAA